MMISDRLKAARAALGLSQREIAAKSGVSARGYQGYEDGRSVPGGDALTGLASLGINVNWLLTGDGEMLRAEGNEERGAPPPNEGYVAVPLYNGVRAAAGHGAVVEHEAPDDALMFKEDWIRFELGTRPEDLRLIRVSGDSMEPTLRSGDVILIDHSATRPDREGIYILRMDGMLLVKRVQAMPGGILNNSSDNAAYAPWQLTRADLEGSDVCIVGRVVWAGRRF